MDQVQESYDEFNLNFRIEDTVIVNQTEMEGFNAFFLGNQSTCQQSVVEGVRVLSYKIPATLPLGQFLKKQLYKGEFLSILSNILNQLLCFTDCNVCEFVQNFISKIRFADMQCVNCVDQILHYLDSRLMFSLREFYTFIIELQKEDILKDDIDLGEGETTVLQQMSYNNITPYLVRSRTNALIPIEKTEFLVGKSSECDYQIPDNRKVSRKHCSFRISNGECYIRDENSTNHTYVNGKMIQPGFDVMLKNDDYIRMGDEEFKYWVR